MYVWLVLLFLLLLLHPHPSSLSYGKRGKKAVENTAGLEWNSTLCDKERMCVKRCSSSNVPMLISAWLMGCLLVDLSHELLPRSYPLYTDCTEAYTSWWIPYRGVLDIDCQLLRATHDDLESTLTPQRAAEGQCTRHTPSIAFWRLPPRRDDVVNQCLEFARTHAATWIRELARCQTPCGRWLAGLTTAWTRDT